MPYFAWRAIDISGTICSGISSARSVQALDSMLLQDEKALLSYEQRIPGILLRPITRRHKITFLKELSILLDSGIFLDQALLLLVEQINHPVFKEILQDISADVHDGVPFSQALQSYPTIFDVLTLHMIRAGEESGRLPQALEQICAYQEEMMQFYQQIKKALILPAITAAFFLIIALIIFIIIVPAFAQMITGSGQQIPPATQLILNISAVLRNPLFLSILGIFCIGTLVIVRLLLKRKKLMLDNVLLYIPFISNLIRQTCCAYFLQSLAMLTQAGVHVMHALPVAQAVISNNVIQKRIAGMVKSVDEGIQLSSAMAAMCPPLFKPEIITLVYIGQESSCLPFVLAKAADMYKQRIMKSLHFITMVIQPLMMIILGLCVTALIFAIYLPIFNISYTIN